MKITRQSALSGVERELEIDVTQDQITMWMTGTLIQNAMPDISADEREFIMTGITTEEWETL